MSTTAFYEESLVLCDVFKSNRSHSGKKTGTPILYYKAQALNTQQDYEDHGLSNDILDDIYYYPDNQNLLELGSAANQLDVEHPIISDASSSPEVWKNFEDMILNPQITTVKRPYNANSYILISAGKDGLFGTPDDMFNFDKEE